MDFTYKKKEKLKSKKAVEQLFTIGKSVSAYPLRLVYVKNNEPSVLCLAIKKGNDSYTIFIPLDKKK